MPDLKASFGVQSKTLCISATDRLGADSIHGLDDVIAWYEMDHVRI